LTKKKILSINIDKGKVHDFKIFKQSKLILNPKIKILADSAYQGIQPAYNADIPVKKTKNNPLSAQDKHNNIILASQRVICEHVIRLIKKFKIISCKYRNRKKRLFLRLILISSFTNFMLS
jgi:hypothetical protein